VKLPLVYTNVQIRNWDSFQKLGVSSIYAPGGYFNGASLDFPVSMGEYHFPALHKNPACCTFCALPANPVYRPKNSIERVATSC
jgi:spermidine dehydrogenase